MLTIQGDILEGGGQILRNSIAYATIFKRPVTITNIRGGRSTPGLRKQHLAGILAAAQLCNAKVTGAGVGSTELIYVPGDLIHIPPEGIRVDIGSAGACSLVIQALLPILLHAPTCRQGANGQGPAPVQVIVTGGTDVPFSPPMDYLSEVLFPRLQTMGVSAAIQVAKRGYMPSGGGQVTLSVVPLDNGQRIQGMEWIVAGEPIVSRACLLTGNMPEDVLAMVMSNVDKSLQEQFALDARRTSTKGGDKMKSGSMGMMMVGKDAQGQTVMVGSSLSAWTKKKGMQGIQTAITRMIQHAVQEYERSLADVVDEFQQDQLIIFMALAESPSTIVTGEISLHTKTAIHFAELFTGAKFTIEEHAGGEESKAKNMIRCVPASQ